MNLPKMSTVKPPGIKPASDVCEDYPNLLVKRFDQKTPILLM